MIRRTGRAQRVLITPIEIAGVASGLQEGLTAQGRQVDVLLRWPHVFRYPLRPFGSRWGRLLAGLVLREHRASGAGRADRGVSLSARIVALPVLALRYDAVVYIGGQTLLRGGIDRAFFRRAGLRVVTVLCGSDARPAWMSGAHVDPAEGAPDLEAIHSATEEGRAVVARAERQSTYVVNHPATCQFHRKRFVDWTALGMPGPGVPAPGRVDARRSGPKGPLVIVHAPSVARWKGTSLIRDAVFELQASGVAVDYVELSGRPHEEVLRTLARADLVLDETYSDAVLAGLGTEAARLGRPVLVWGYAQELVRRCAERVGAPTDHFAHPGTVAARVRELAVDTERRERLGVELRAFVESTWSREAVAGRYGRLLDDGPDLSWWDEPREWAYASGWGVSESTLRPFLRAYVERFGREGLLLGFPEAYAGQLDRLLAPPDDTVGEATGD